MLAWAVIAGVAGMWAGAAGSLVAAGFALRAVARRRLTLGSRLFLWREPTRIIDGTKAVRGGLAITAVSLFLALLFLGLAVKSTPVLWHVSASLRRAPAPNPADHRPAP